MSSIALSASARACAASARYSFMTVRISWSRRRSAGSGIGHWYEPAGVCSIYRKHNGAAKFIVRPAMPRARHDEIAGALKTALTPYATSEGIVMESSSWKVTARNPA